MGGRAKFALEIGGCALLVRVTDALAAAQRIVVVGDSVPGARADVVCREEPPGAGPVAALAAGLPHIRADAVVLLAADLPFLTPAAIEALLGALAGADRSVAVDDAGRAQPLLSAWRTKSLRAAVSNMGEPGGAAMRSLRADRTVRLELPGDPPPWWDCDDPPGLARARAAAEEAPDG